MTQIFLDNRRLFDHGNHYHPATALLQQPTATLNTRRHNLAQSMRDALASSMFGSIAEPAFRERRLENAPSPSQDDSTPSEYQSHASMMRGAVRMEQCEETAQLSEPDLLEKVRLLQ